MQRANTLVHSTYWTETTMKPQFHRPQNRGLIVIETEVGQCQN